MRKNIFLVFAVFISVFIASANITYAVEEAGIKLIPATIEKLADPGAVLVEELSITNVSDQDREYYIYKRNIKGVEDGGVPVFSSEDEERTGYEITEWIELQSESIQIAKGETVSFPVTIKVPESATPGSHFGGIFVSLEPPKLRETGAAVGYEVASVVSIRISGDVRDEARIRSLSTSKLFYPSKHVDFMAKVENQGNILIRPYGPLTIKSMFGGKEKVVSVNESLAGVFPGTIRDLQFSWEEEGIGFGRYEAVLALVYDAEVGQKTIDASIVFWVFPLKVILPILFAFVVFVARSISGQKSSDAIAIAEFAPKLSRFLYGCVRA